MSKVFSVVVERDIEIGLLIDHVPGWPSTHSYGGDVDELRANLQEVIAMLLEDGEPDLASEFVYVQEIAVA